MLAIIHQEPVTNDWTGTSFSNHYIRAIDVLNITSCFSLIANTIQRFLEIQYWLSGLFFVCENKSFDEKVLDYFFYFKLKNDGRRNPKARVGKLLNSFLNSFKAIFLFWNVNSTNGVDLCIRLFSYEQAWIFGWLIVWLFANKCRQRTRISAFRFK